MSTTNRDLSVLKRGFVSQLESGPLSTFPVYRSPQNRTTYVQKIVVTNNTSSSGTFDIGLYENSFIPGGNVFVMTLNATNAYTSTDGINWVTRSNAIPSGTWNAKMVHGNGVYFVWSNDANTTAAASSTDGAVWTTRTLPAAANWRGFTYGNATFVGVAGNGSVTTATTSTDGITWTLRTMPSAQSWFNVFYGNGIFIATTISNTDVYATSTDGITWTSRILPSANYWASGDYGNGTFVLNSIIGSSTALSSTNGTTWISRAMPTSASWYNTVFGNGTFVSVAGYNNPSTTAATSTDGMTWVLRTVSTSETWSRVAFGAGIFMVASTNGFNYITSTDGITWTTRTVPNTMGSIAYPQRSDFSSDNWLYKSVTLAGNTTQSISYEVMVPPTHEIRVRSTVPVQVTIMGEVQA